MTLYLSLIPAGVELAHPNFEGAECMGYKDDRWSLFDTRSCEGGK